ncbi:MAG: hypothetical protein PVF83_11420, partial [Anaerolineales bacterium]
IQYILLGIVIVLNWIASILAYVVPFLVDIVYRIIYLILSILFYTIITPIDGIITAVSSPFKIGSAGGDKGD